MDHTDARDALASSLPSRATTASARRRQEREPALALPICTLCRARCRHSVAEPLLQCPRCNNRSYCTRVCRARDWDVGHAKECMELQPLEMQVRVYICIWVYGCLRLECRPCRIRLQLHTFQSEKGNGCIDGAARSIDARCNTLPHTAKHTNKLQHRIAWSCSRLKCRCVYTYAYVCISASMYLYT